MFQELVGLFKSSSIQDIYLLGFVNVEDGAADFCPDLHYYCY